LAAAVIGEGHRRQRLAIVCPPGLETFVEPLAAGLEADYVVDRCYAGDLRAIARAVGTADIVWLEWASRLAIWATGHLDTLDRKPVICRLHSYEAFTPELERMRWDRVDALVLVGEHVRRLLAETRPEVIARARSVEVIPNGVALDRFRLALPKCPGKEIAYVGFINFKKGPQLLLHAFRAIADRDPGFRLHIAGRFQEPRYQLYFAHLIEEWSWQDRLIVHGWVDDVPQWLADKQYVLSTSLFEGGPTGILEAMASGLKPLIHKFPGAGELFPTEYCWTSIPELVELATDGEYEPASYRAFVEERYAFATQLDRIRRLLRSLAPR
jgi:glycosyltransferase involved in cell wall biosynthesis